MVEGGKETDQDEPLKRSQPLSSFQGLSSFFLLLFLFYFWGGGQGFSV